MNATPKTRYDAAIELIRGLDILREKQQVGMEISAEEYRYINELSARFDSFLTEGRIIEMWNEIVKDKPE